MTILGDTCNLYQGSLDVAEFCQADRLQRNAAPFCDVEADVLKTEMGCPDQGLVPRVLEMNLDQNNVDPNSKVLNLTWGGETIVVETGR